MEKILCATLTDLFEVCKITESLADLVQEGNYICTGSRSGKETKGVGSRNGQRKKSETGGSSGKGSPTGGASSRGVRRGNPTRKGGTVTKYPNSTEGPPDIVAPKVSIPRFVKRIASRKIKKFAKDNNLTSILPKDGTINAILNGQWNGQGIVPGSTVESNSGTGASGTGSRRGRRQALNGEGMFPHSRSCLYRKKREAGEIKFNLRSLLSTFRSLQSGNLSGGLLQPLTVS